ncbi:hypothetical protein IZY60_10690 [Lutibacter sp. B2]|nr:hypothetical protein [Lutibacter sp. B2]
MEKFETYSNKKLTLSYKIILIFLGSVLLLYGFYFKEYKKIFISILLIYLSFFEKKVFITKEGIISQRKGLGFKSRDLIPFTHITNIRIQEVNEKTGLHFMENHMARRIIIDTKYVNDIVELSKNSNKKIYIDHIK